MVIWEFKEKTEKRESRFYAYMDACMKMHPEQARSERMSEPVESEEQTDPAVSEQPTAPGISGEAPRTVKSEEGE